MLGDLTEIVTHSGKIVNDGLMTAMERVIKKIDRRILSDIQEE